MSQVWENTFTEVHVVLLKCYVIKELFCILYQKKPQLAHLFFPLSSWKMDCTFYSSVELVIVAVWQQARIS